MASDCDKSSEKNLYGHDPIGVNILHVVMLNAYMIAPSGQNDLDNKNSIRFV